MDDTHLLFEPLNVRGRVLRNRVVMPPMVTLRGIATSAGIAWYGRHARGGVGLAIVEATSVGAFRAELDVAGLRPLVEAIHAGGALAAIQLFPVTFGRAAAPADLTRAELDAILDDYARAAAVCRAAGFDGVEPHGAHGFLLNQFFSPAQNRRTDEFGGTPENRMRLGLAIAERVRRNLGDDGLLLYRHTPVGEGYGLAESLTFARRLVAAGVDILDISPASDARPCDRAAPFRELGVPVIGVNDLDEVPRALEALREGRTDLVAVGRGLIADPDWPEKVRTGRLAEIVRCTKCEALCFGNLDKGIPVACTQW